MLMQWTAFEKEEMLNMTVFIRCFIYLWIYPTEATSGKRIDLNLNIFAKNNLYLCNFLMSAQKQHTQTGNAYK